MQSTSSKNVGSVVIDDTKTRHLGAGCLFLFALPFLVVGLLLCARAIRDITSGATLETMALSAIGGIAFSAAGAGVFALGLVARRKHDEAVALRAQYPAQPWLWDPQWATGRIESNPRTGLVGAWSLTLFWNAVASVVFLFVPEELAKGNTAAVLALVFPLVGVGILLWAVRITLRWRKFGTSTLELSTTPVPLGGTLQARLLTRLEPPPERMQLVLTCVRRDHTAENTSDELVWLEEKVVRSEEMRREVLGTVVPVAFTIPLTAPESSRNVVGKSIHWKLHASAVVAGVDYQSRFELPVFRVRDSVHQPPTQSASRQHASRLLTVDARVSDFDPAHATVRTGHSAYGYEFYFGPGRNPGATVSFAIMAGIFLAATYGIFRLGIPLFFVGLCGAVALLLLLLTLNIWLGTRRVEITSDHVLVRKSLLGLGSTTRIPRSDVRSVNLKIGMSQTETALQSPRAWYDIKLQRRSGRQITLGSNIASKREAEWLVAELRRVLRLMDGRNTPM